jgi:hypothetical protein
MTSSFVPCAQTVAHRLTTGFSGDDLLSKICVAHLSGLLRVVVAFSAQNVGTILLIGPHDDHDPFMDVYSQLYELAGLTKPPAAERTKPPCCGEEDGKPPVPNRELLEDLIDQARSPVWAFCTV